MDDEQYSDGFQEEDIDDEVLSDGAGGQKAAVDSKAKVQSKKEVEDDDDDYEDPGEFAEISVKDESEEEKEMPAEVADQISIDDQSLKSAEENTLAKPKASATEEQKARTKGNT